MYASTEKKIPWGIISSIVAIFIIALGGYTWYSYQQSQSLPSLEISLEGETAAVTPAPSPVADPNSPIIEELRAENETLIARLDTLESSQKALEAERQHLESLKIGQAVLQDFTKRFFQYEKLLNAQSFFQFFNYLVTDYIANLRVSVRTMETTDPAFQKVHRELVEWVLAQDDEKLESLAHLVGFHMIERLYRLPLSLMASGLSTEIEAIDYQKPLFMREQETPPVRDANGELRMPAIAHLANYTEAQQFFYRRGPAFSEKVVTFLQAYLAYEGY